MARPVHCHTADCIKDRQRHKDRYWSDPEKERQRSRLHRYIKYKHGITLEGYDRLYAIQGGRCAICGVHQSELKRALHVDHDHETNEIRGLLCSHCNLVLGHAHDSVVVLISAASYLGRKQ